MGGGGDGGEGGVKRVRGAGMGRWGMGRGE